MCWRPRWPEAGPLATRLGTLPSVAPGAYAFDLRAADDQDKKLRLDIGPPTGFWIPPSIHSRSSPRPATRIWWRASRRPRTSSNRPRMTQTIQFPPMPAPWPRHWRRWRVDRRPIETAPPTAVVPSPEVPCSGNCRTRSRLPMSRSTIFRQKMKRDWLTVNTASGAGTVATRACCRDFSDAIREGRPAPAPPSRSADPATVVGALYQAGILLYYRHPGAAGGGVAPRQQRQPAP